MVSAVTLRAARQYGGAVRTRAKRFRAGTAIADPFPAANATTTCRLHLGERATCSFLVYRLDVSRTAIARVARVPYRDVQPRGRAETRGRAHASRFRVRVSTARSPGGRRAGAVARMSGSIADRERHGAPNAGRR